MTSRFPCPRTCETCGKDFTVMSHKNYQHHRIGRCAACRSGEKKKGNLFSYPEVTLPVLPGAACAGMDTELWFPERYDDPAPAKAICAACPVRRSCLQWAVDNDEQHGIFGGLDRRQRVRLTDGN